MATQDKSAVLGDVVNCALEPRDVRHTQTDIRRLAFMDTLSSEEMGRLSQLLTSAVSLAQVERGMLIPSNRVLQHKEVVGQFSDILGANFRFEDTAGHTWHSILVAIELAPRLGKKVNLERVLMMLAIHDLCEIELKDTIVFRGKKPTPDEEQEALYKLVQSSPQRELYLELFREFQKAQELQENPELAEEFKRASELPRDQKPKDIPTIDAVFAVSVDVLSACFVLLSTSKTKAVELWKTYNYSRTRFEKERFKPVCDWNPFLKEYYRYLFAKIDEKIGWSCG